MGFILQGCDGSVLLEDAPGIDSELNGLGNLGIQGLEIVDAIKAAVERECPGIVSCADILAQASKDSVDVVIINSYSKVQVCSHTQKMKRILNLGNFLFFVC